MQCLLQSFVDYLPAFFIHPVTHTKFTLEGTKYQLTIGRLIILNLNHFHILTIYILLYESTSLSYVYKSKYLPQMRQLSLLQFPYSSLRKYTRGTDSIIITIHPFAGRHTKQDIQTSLNVLLIKYLICNVSASIGRKFQPLPGKASLSNVCLYPLSAYHHRRTSGSYRATMCGAITHTGCRSATYHYSG